ncbi:MAG: phosphoserine phosphatase [Acidobacteria bacterium]|nr:phosphoserine phosphatase [Acidobacteriota bacterium]
MSELQTPKAIVFLDFDGTITRRDAIDAILEVYADPQWVSLETDWQEGRIGSRDCLQSQMALVRATHTQLDALLDEIEIDEGFEALLETCVANGVGAHIISDGFGYCISRILARLGHEVAAQLAGISASRLVLEGDVWRTEFPFFHQSCGHGCATCKPAVMRLLNHTNAPVVFVGDGLSDRYAVECADHVFAKSGLAAYCRNNSIEHTAYQSLEEVATVLDRRLLSGRFLEAERKTRASA